MTWKSPLLSCLLCAGLAVTACGGDAEAPVAQRAPLPGSAAQAPVADTAEPQAAQADVPPPAPVTLPEGLTLPPYPAAGQLLMISQDGPFGDATFLGAPREASYSRSYDQIYAQTTPSQGAALTYTFRGLTARGPGLHNVQDVFTVYGGDGGLTEYVFRGFVQVDIVDAAAGRFRFAYIGSIVGGEPSQSGRVKGAVDVTLPVGD